METLPERFGPWKPVYNRFNSWAKKGRWGSLIFKALQLEVDEVGSTVDGSVVRHTNPTDRASSQSLAHVQQALSRRVLVHNSSASAPSPRASRRRRGTSSHSPKSHAHGYGLRQIRHAPERALLLWQRALLRNEWCVDGGAAPGSQAATDVLR